MKHEPFLIHRPNGYTYIRYFDKTKGKLRDVTTDLSWKIPEQKRRETKALEKFRQKWKAGDTEEPKEILFSDFITLFLELSNYDNEVIKKKYINIRNQVISFLKDRLLQHYTTLDFDRFLRNKANAFSVNTILNYRRKLNAIFNKAVLYGYVNKNVITNCIKFKLPEPEPNPMSKEEFNTLISSIKLPLYADLFTFAVLSGLRMNELINLKSSHIDTSKKLITVLSDKEHRTKSRKTRFVELHSSLIPIYEKYKHQEYLFIGNRDKKKLSRRWLIKITKQLVKQSGINPEYTFHTFRKTFGYWLLLEGVNLKYISQALGHSGIRVTEVFYSKYITNESMGWIEKVKI